MPWDQQEWLAQQFEAQRPRLRAVADRMLGSLSKADDAVQDAWLRLSRTDTSEVDNLGGWLTTVVARVALNVLQARNTRREEPLDVRVPDPIIDPTEGTNPEHEARARAGLLEPAHASTGPAARRLRSPPPSAQLPVAA